MSTIEAKEVASQGRTAQSPRLRLDRPHGIVELAIDNARHCLLNLQQQDGHWVAELQGDTILESEYVLLMAFLGREHEERIAKAARYILSQERPDGGWSNYPGGPVDLSVTVKAYFALKLAGHDIQAPYMVRARSAILELGGAAGCNSFTKFYLAFLGQSPYDNCPSVPAEMMFLPRWCYVNLYAMSAWTRTIVVPLTIFSAFKPVRQLPEHLGIPELFVQAPQTKLWPHPPTRRLLTATNFFLAIDQILKLYESCAPKFVRRAAVAKASDWMRSHFADSDGVGAIFPPMIYTIISLHCLGYHQDSPEMTYALKQLDMLMIEEEDTLRLQPCFSPVWDTALALNTLAFAGISSHDPAVVKAARWLLDRECRRNGDWSLCNPELEPSGWYFEYRNGFYPDVDDTAMVLMGLARTGQAWEHPALRPSENGKSVNGNGKPFSENGKDHRKLIPAVERSLHWLLGMQNRDGGWAAFDRDIDHELLTRIPFADHNAMLDPSCPDITARVLEALGQFGYRPDHPQIARALAFLEQTQDARGCWIGRWDVNYIYGTWQVLQGLEAIRYNMRLPMVRRGVAWLEKVQQPCGGWGESCQSYNDPRLAGQGTTTASQTGWALLALIAAGETDSESVRNGVHYLVSTQNGEGTWDEDEFTGTGFPKVFYLKYHNYRLYFPLMALARYQRHLAGSSESAGREFHLDRKHGKVTNYTYV
jgi:squalene-hopene/tetraprenyl-beta-curcumene cyclase